MTPQWLLRIMLSRRGRRWAARPRRLVSAHSSSTSRDRSDVALGLLAVSHRRRPAPTSDGWRRRARLAPSMSTTFPIAVRRATG